MTRNEAAERFMETVSAAVLDPTIAMMIGGTGPALLALVSPDAIRDAMQEAVAEERRHVIEQIQERIYPDMLGDPIGKDGESMLTILDDLSTPEQPDE